MISEQIYLIINIMMLLDGIILIATGKIAYLMSLDMISDGMVMARADYIGSVLFVMFLNNFLMGKNGFYSAKRFPSYPVMVVVLFRTLTLDFIILAAAASLAGINPFPRSFLVPFYILTLILLLTVRLALYYYFDHFAGLSFNAWKILLVGSASRIKLVAHVLEKQRNWGHQIVGCLNVDDDKQQNGDLPNLGRIEDFDNILRDYEIDEVVLALPSEYPIELKKLLNKCEEIGIAIKIVPGLLDLNLPYRLKVESLMGIPTLSYNVGHMSASGWFYKRLLDLAGGLAGFMLLAVMYPIVALMIKLDSPGPVFFKQVRIGRNGRRFYLYKFRTMVADAEVRKEELLKYNEMNGPMFKVEKDPRITRVGRFLRKTSLDEFPQFINVLKGEMSLVGTRPPTLNEVRQYEDWHRRRISTKPGITGLWQVSGRNKINDFVDVVAFDLQYIDNWRFSTDLRILLKTVWVVMTRKGAK